MRIVRTPPANLKKIGLYLGIAAFLSFAGLLAYGPFDKWRYGDISSFDSARWKKPDLKYRYSVLPIVGTQIIKPGLNEEQVLSLLGTPNAVTADDDWQYEIQQPGWKAANWTGGGLLIKFDRDRHVIETMDNTITD